MKHLYNLSLALLLLTASCGPDKPANELKSATMEVVAFQTETMFNVTCDKFDYYYKDKWHSKTITDKAQLDKLTKLIDALYRTDNSYEPDVRGKILLTNTDGSVDTVCMDSKVTRYKGVSYETTTELANFVQQQ
ncbi:hypothetical protein EOD41_15310 [Mucilaginibacter limnophilus]|uniref:Uncharacterized protein n=1 Tax=Mucilaginibacter limnophilus TaxID=1932778 RepID=A0A3S2UMS5_9SPHI|nr:hypothetical protein [Mucilaginibacter limnophilus]RVT99808.1 hypothetical protein EOD41_15310 [Mucilaginibacter limnophilus]